jgi:hypothetical protein
MLTRAAAALLVVALVGATAGAETAREILDRRKALDDGPRHWDDRHEKIKLTIVGHGPDRVRELDLFDRREPGDEQKTILFFLAPAEVKGTAFLAFTHKSRPADQWLWLPALGRVRQITARARDESFVGTDLSYHDLDLIQEMTSWSEADARSSLRPDETLDGVATHVIELAPQREDIGYKKVVLWLGNDDLVPRQIDFFEDGSQAKKRIVQRDIEPVGAIPVARRIEVATPEKGSHTAIEVSDVQFNQHLDPDLFTQRYLERGAP